MRQEKMIVENALYPTVTLNLLRFRVAGRHPGGRERDLMGGSPR